MFCEPQLGKRGLYPNVSTKDFGQEFKIIIDLISYADGINSLLEIANLIHCPIWKLYEVVTILKNNQLLLVSDKSDFK